MRKRTVTDASGNVVNGAVSTEARTAPLFKEIEGPPPSAKIPIEDDLSAMCIAIKKKSYRVGLLKITGWTPQERHVVAMWLTGMTEDLPAVVERDGIQLFAGAEETAGDMFKSNPPAKVVITDAAVAASQQKLAEAQALAKQKAEEQAAKNAAKREAEQNERSRVANQESVAGGTVLGGELLSLDVPETVTVVWGEEKYSQNYSTFTVGPFSATANVPLGKTRAEVMRELYADLDAMGREQLKAKGDKFMRTVGAIKGGA